MKKQIYLLLFCTIAMMSASAQNSLTGKITDEQGETLIGVTIYEKGTTNGTTSDFNGNYNLKYSKTNALIVFSYVGFTTHEVNANGRTTLDMVMKQGLDLNAVEIVGSRRLNRTATETTVPVDIIDVSKVTSTTGMVEINQLLQYAAPSFNSNKQSGADGADHIDPATLRGLGPDQTLVLINGKRRHQSSLINIFGSRGRGNTGTDLNTIPASSIERIEILRDGASAQYGSDAIAGVINIVLKSNVNEFTGSFSTGTFNAKPPSDVNVLSTEDYDGGTVQVNGNYGVKIKDDGYLNLTMDYQDKQHTNRPSDPTKFDIYRNQFGDAAQENFGAYFNSEFSAGSNARVYAFGGFNHRFTDAYAWTRVPDEERNVIEIYPNGFDPKIQSVINDKSVSTGIKSQINKWNMDFNNTFGSNRFHFIVDNTLNATLLANSPTRFDAGGFELSQNTTGMNMSRLYNSFCSGLNLAMGAEYRVENYSIFAGEEGSYQNYGPVYFVYDLFDDDGNVVGQDSTLRPGGSQGFPGFQPSNELDESRTNLGIYADAELDVTQAFVVSAAGRFERYSDFGNTVNGKLAARYKITSAVSIRAAASSGFRAPSLAQLYYNTTFTDFVAGVPIDKIIAKNNSPITRALGIPELKEENSVNISGGIAANYKAFTITLDGYSVKIEDRIVLTGAFTDDDPDIGAELQQLNVGAAQFFTNAVNTTTTGVDAILSYSLWLAGKHNLKFTLAGNFNEMKIDKIYTNKKLEGKEGTYFGVREQYFLLASAPKSKMTFGVEYGYSNFVGSLRFTQFGKVELINFNDDGDDVITVSDDPFTNELDVYDPKVTTDLSIGYKFKNAQLTIGGNNVLNTYPDQQDPALTESGGLWDAAQMGFSGAYYYTRLSFKF